MNLFLKINTMFNLTKAIIRNRVQTVMSSRMTRYLNYLFRLIEGLLKVILNLKLEFRLNMVARDKLRRIRGGEHANMLMFRLKLTTSQFNFTKNNSILI